ncbi:MAG: redox-regulated ATPase YchF [Bacilli bacterium]|nr:redox-regulated ATPase YchF [Bacilli bacterium]
MPLKAGIVGLPNVGKSTLFNAITNSRVEAANYPFATIKPNTGVVVVPDERLEYLSNLFKPERTIHATFEFYDIAGLVRGASKGEGLGNQFLAHIRECDAIVQVVRCFESAEIIHVENNVDPRRDIETINYELALADLETIDKRISKIENKARLAKDKELVYEMSILSVIKENLEKGISARNCPLTSEQIAYANKNFQLLTLKPLIYVANVSEEDYADLNNAKHYQEVIRVGGEEKAQVIPISCEIEYQLSLLSKEERSEFLQEMGASESGLDKVIKATYRLLDLATFFTVGADECRAWTYKHGMSAPQCAGVIHSDFQKGFIKAEVYSYAALREFGTELAVKEAGKLRIEGRDYLVKDGDIMFFRFNV